MSLHHQRADVRCALDTDFWRSAIAQRHALLAEITTGLAAVPGAGPALAAVEAARAVLTELDAGVLSGYVGRWLEDVQQWQRRLELLPRLDSVDAALDYLDLPYLAREDRVLEDRVLEDRVLEDRVLEDRVLEPVPA